MTKTLVVGLGSTAFRTATYTSHEVRQFREPILATTTTTTTQNNNNNTHDTTTNNDSSNFRTATYTSHEVSIDKKQTTTNNQINANT